MTAINHVWQINTAKSRFSEMVDAALERGEQIITKHGKPILKLVALPAVPSAKPLAKAKPKMSFGEFLLTAPKIGDFEYKLSSPNRRPAFSFEE